MSKGGNTNGEANEIQTGNLDDMLGQGYDIMKVENENVSMIGMEEYYSTLGVAPHVLYENNGNYSDRKNVPGVRSEHPYQSSGNPNMSTYDASQSFIDSVEMHPQDMLHSQRKRPSNGMNKLRSIFTLERRRVFGGSLKHHTISVHFVAVPKPLLESTCAHRNKTEKNCKGLRHFSNKVCEKVQQKKLTTYNEVADELVSEFGGIERGSVHEQNIRRRVYDALNVLMAMNIISKDKKEIRWLGLPCNSAQQQMKLQNERNSLIIKARTKLKTLYELIIQQIALQNLINYNNEQIIKNGAAVQKEKQIKLPFIAVDAPKDAVVNCSVSRDRDEYRFSFSTDFQVLSDTEILKKLGFTCNLDSPTFSMSDLQKALNLVPPNLSFYINAMGGKSVEEFQDVVMSNRYLLNSDDNMMSFYHAICNNFKAEESLSNLNGSMKHNNNTLCSDSAYVTGGCSSTQPESCVDSSIFQSTAVNFKNDQN